MCRRGVPEDGIDVVPKGREVDHRHGFEAAKGHIPRRCQLTYEGGNEVIVNPRRHRNRSLSSHSRHEIEGVAHKADAVFGFQVYLGHF